MQRRDVQLSCPFVLAVVVFVLLAGSSRPACADVFILASGGQLRGQWINRDQPPRDFYVIQTAHGGRLTLAKSQVTEAILQRPDEVEYDRVAPTFANTVAGQWSLAEWCRERLLDKQRAAHLRRIVELEPDHAAARHGLGYTQFNGQWVLNEAWRKDEGYVLYRGRWRTAQEIELIEAERKRELAEREWLGKLKRYRTQMQTPQAAEARDAILAIRDPHAVPALASYLKKDRSRGMKMLYVTALGGIGNPAAERVLVETTLNDPDVEVFHACADEIVRLDAPLAAAAYIKGLKDANNVRVNRSAQVIGRLDVQDAFVPLIDALITTHVVVYTPPGGSSPDAISPTFVTPINDAAKQLMPSGGSTMNTGGKTQRIPVQVPNQDVLEALVKLSGGISFGFDKKAWSAWHSIHREQRPALELRGNGN